MKYIQKCNNDYPVFVNISRLKLVSARDISAKRNFRKLARTTLRQNHKIRNIVIYQYIIRLIAELFNYYILCNCIIYICRYEVVLINKNIDNAADFQVIIVEAKPED